MLTERLVMKALQGSIVGSVAAGFAALGVVAILATTTHAPAAAAAQADALSGQGEVLVGRLPAPGAGNVQRPMPAIVELVPSL